MRWYLLLITAILGLGMFFVWRMESGSPVGEKSGFKNLLLVTVDTVRADHIGCYGHSGASTPNLDGMAQRGVVFERCITVAPITLPSHASILTGIYPFNHGARNNGTHFLPEDVPTLAESLSEAGFATGAVVSALVLDSRYGLDQGFDAYDDDLASAEKAPMFMFRETKAADTAQRAIRWLQDRADERWFLWVHFFDPHANYDPPEVFAAKCPDSPYDGEIAYADAGLGEILASLGTRNMLDETLVVMTSDHGESLGEHGETTHAMFIYDATTRVPLIFMHPSLAQRKRVRTVLSSVDIAPTVLDLLDVSGTQGLDGRSVARALVVRDAQPEPVPVYSEAMSPYFNHGWSDLRAIRDDTGRFIRAPRPELYDLVRDGRELNNLYAAETAAPYASSLEDFLPNAEADVRGDDIRSMDPDVRDALAALGYVWSSDEAGDEVPAGERPDPKDMMHVWERSQRANELVRAERYDEAEAALRQILVEDPGNVISRSSLAGILARQERHEEALQLMRETVALPGARTNNWLRLAALERELGLPDWKATLQKAKDFDPRDPMSFVREGDWLQDDGEADGAILAYETALELDGRCSKAWVGIGNTEHRRGNEAEAEAALKRAIETDPVNTEAWYNLGVVMEAVGRVPEAFQAYFKARELEPEHVLTLVNLANLHIKSDRLGEAEALYVEALELEPADFNGNFNLGLHYLRTGRPKEAAVVFARACAEQADKVDAWRYLMVARRRSGELGGALEAATGVLALDPDDMPALLTTAVVGNELGKEGARASLQHALDLDTAAVEARAERDPGLRAALDALRSND
ncbi:MAG: sulfatase-like hydrolase/transferase [bacterium]|nr:sulfatase-like hydrolase/transferase [bacterium]